jgi:hypothetical protein
VAKRKTTRTVAALMMRAHNSAASRAATRIQVDVVERQAVIVRTIIDGEERAHIFLDAEQLDELMRLLESSLRELK